MTDALTEAAGARAALTVYVWGQPKPKGSLRHVGGGRMVEQLEGSKPWRVAVKEAALLAVWTRDPEWREVNHPLQGPLSVTATVTVTKPKSAPKRRRIWPATRSSGDIDKHLRNIFDALQDAYVMDDDAQFVETTVRKCFPGEGDDALPTPGAVIRIFRIGEEWS